MVNRKGSSQAIAIVVVVLLIVGALIVWMYVRSPSVTYSENSDESTNVPSYPVDDSPQEPMMTVHQCSMEAKNADFCTKEYRPVCGWFDSKTIQCLKYPCAQTFSNSCDACVDDKVTSWTEGICPTA